MDKTNLSVIILAAGKGTRMKSSLPKTLHKVAGIPMVNMVIAKANSLKPKNVCVIISEEMQQYSAKIKNEFPNSKIEFVIQEERLGTGHAVKIALQNISEIAENVIILYADTPLIKEETLEKMLLKIQRRAICVLGFECKEQNQYGRLVTNQDVLEKIVEFKDANSEEQGITLCNSGVIAIKHQNSLELINKISNNNKAQEYYLTDIVDIAKKENLQASFIECNQEEVLGVNSRLELSRVEKLKQNEIRNKLMANGVTLIDPETTHFSYNIKIANDVIIHPNVVIGNDVEIKSGCEIKSFSHLEGCIINNATIGPFARIRPGTIIEDEAKIGNFVEVKNSNVKNGAKISHLSYIGDSEIGKNSNIGAGTITCNYDGYNKFKTEIGENVFVGSNSAIVAPVKIEPNSIIGAGSVITKDVEENSLAVSRSKQNNIKNAANKYHSDRRKS